MGKLLAGVDEAGRGPVLGPMVFAVAVMDESRLGELEELGVTDSKLIPKEKREELLPVLNEICVEYKELSVSAKEITEWMCGASLNDLEQVKTIELLDSLECTPHKCIVDCPDPVASRYGEGISALLKKDTQIISEHKADLNHRIVGAASILAKVTRDSAIEELSKEHGELGCGYPSDPKTQAWIALQWEKNKSFPDFVRMRWATIRRLAQTSLDDF